MATVYGVNRTKIRAMSPVNLLEPEQTGAKVKWVYDEYVTAALAAGSIIEVCPNLPDEARIVDWIIDHDALADVSLRFGTSADDDEFMANVSCASAGKKNFTSNGISLSLGFEIESGDGQTLIITTAGPSAATGTIKVAVAYTTKG